LKLLVAQRRLETAYRSNLLALLDPWRRKRCTISKRR